MNSALQNFSHHLDLLRYGMLHPIKNWLSIIFLKSSGRCGVRASFGTGTDATPGGGVEHRHRQRHGRYLSRTASGARGSVTAGRYAATNVRFHQPRSPGLVKWYRYQSAQINFGGASEKGLWANSRTIRLSPSSSRWTNVRNHGCKSGGDMAANHICQSSFQWYGETMQGARFTSPGFPLNSYSRH